MHKDSASDLNMKHLKGQCVQFSETWQNELGRNDI